MCRGSRIRSQILPGNSSSVCFFEVAICGKSSYDFLDLYGRFCPYNPPYKPGGKTSTPPRPFCQGWEHFFKNRLAWLHQKLQYKCNHGGRFLKNVLIFEKKGGCWFFSRVCMVGCMGRISHTNLKNRMVVSRIANLEKSRRTTGPRSDLRPDSWSRANSGLDMSSRIFENWIFTSPLYRCRFTAIHGYTTAVVLEYRYLVAEFRFWGVFSRNSRILKKPGQKRLSNGFSARNAFTNACWETPGPAPTPM